MQKNKPYTFTTEDGKTKTLYDGRYACVTAIVFAVENNEVFVLANRRGNGSQAVDAEGVNNVGKWNMPCGYMDAGSAEENAARECLEETGVNIPASEFKFMGTSNTGTERNVTLRYLAIIDKKAELPDVSELRGGEENEVSEIKWIRLDKIDEYTWAFNHGLIAKGIFDILLNNMGVAK